MCRSFYFYVIIVAIVVQYAQTFIMCRQKIARISNPPKPPSPRFRSSMRSLKRLTERNSVVRSNLVIALTPWYQDDLPNILGINPLEAAVIFGGLYYYYGPTTLYRYTREAGIFFSTYAPIVRDVITDIVEEFREYLDEDREREDLMNAGVDIDNLPRRTTNILERLQESIDEFSGVTSDVDNDVDSSPKRDTPEMGSAPFLSTINSEKDSSPSSLVRDKEEVVTLPSGEKKVKLRRRSKREMIVQSDFADFADMSLTSDEKESNDSVAQYISTTKYGFGNFSKDENTYVRDMQDLVTEEGAGAIASMGSAGIQPTSTVSSQNMMTQQKQREAAFILQKKYAEAEAKADAIKFSQQMSGDWNANVIKNEKSLSSAETDEVGKVNTFGWPIDLDGEFKLENREDEVDARFLLDSEWKYSEFLDSSLVADIPSDLSATDTTNTTISNTNVIISNDSTSRVTLQVLKELDRDYLSLRQRVISLIENQDGLESNPYSREK